MMEDITRPSNTALRTDLLCSRGLRFLYGILDKDIVSITTNVQMVRSDLIDGVNAVGNHPARLVISATIIAAIIMNALLFSRPLMLMHMESPYSYLIIDYR